jgi:hypothetical protein
MSERTAHTPGAETGGGSLRRILDRFRRTSGVPAAVAEDLAAELAPLFTLLDRIEQEAEAIREDAERRIASTHSETAEEVEAILTDAAHQAEAERAEVAKAARREAGARSRALAAAGAREADRIRTTGRSRIPELTAEVVRCLQRLGEPET